MAEIEKKTYYFKLVGKMVYYFRVDYFGFREDLPPEEGDGIILTEFLNKRLKLTPFATWTAHTEYIDNIASQYSLKYEFIEDETEINNLKLLYED